MSNDILPGASYAEALSTIVKLGTPLIPPTEVQIMRATARLPFTKAFAEWRLKQLKKKELQHWVRVVKREGYDPLTFVKYVNQHEAATPLDSLQAYLIKQAIEKK
jgi:hypothetical protein